jgi:hypothetical protein
MSKQDRPKRVRGLVQGVGINDANYKVTIYEGSPPKIIWICPYYKRWKSMIVRCYSLVYQRDYPTYKGCYVAEDWLTFSKFRAWMVEQEILLGDLSKMHLDKDFLSSDTGGRKVYSEDSCAFIHRKVNLFMGDYFKNVNMLQGTHLKHETGKYVASCSNPFTPKSCTEHIGLYTTKEEAHMAWAKTKLAYAVRFIEEGYVKDYRIATALLSKYNELLLSAENILKGDI